MCAEMLTVGWLRSPALFFREGGFPDSDYTDCFIRLTRLLHTGLEDCFMQFLTTFHG